MLNSPQYFTSTIGYLNVTTTKIDTNRYVSTLKK